MWQVLRQVEDGGIALAVGYPLLGPDFPPKRHAFRDGQVEEATVLPAHDHRPGQQLSRLLSARCERIKKSCQDFRLYRLQMSERVTIFRFQAVSGGTLQNIVHDRGALRGNLAAAIRQKR